DLRMDYTALGHTVGLAQRMEQLAEPGKPLLTERTAKLVTGFFSVRDLGPSRVKGMTEPIRLYELEGAGRLRTRFDVSRARGLSRFVGRAPEMAALEASLERALAGEGQIVGVVGEPGVGKSRLCHEFAERGPRRGSLRRRCSARSSTSRNASCSSAPGVESSGPSSSRTYTGSTRQVTRCSPHSKSSPRTRRRSG